MPDETNDATLASERWITYCMFRYRLWHEGRGTYDEIDQQFGDGLLEKEWMDFLNPDRRKKDGADHAE